MQIIDKLLTLGNTHGRTGTKLVPKGIVIHYVGNSGSSAIGNRDYFENGSGGNYVSAHYIIGLDGTILRCIPENECAAHAGKSYGAKYKDMAKTNNSRLLGIECCHPSSTGKFSDATYKALIELVVDICKRYGFNPGMDVCRHYDVSGKACPLYYVNYSMAWETLKKDIINCFTAVDISNLTPIMGKPILTQAQFMKYRKTRKETPKLTNGNFETLINTYYAVAEKEGVRADIALCQAFHETGFFQYGGIVQPNQNNFAGLGAVDGNKKGQCNSFADVKKGVTAHVQHLKGYASVEPLKLSLEDIRYNLINPKGYTPWVEWLSIPNNPNTTAIKKVGWASDKDYFTKIMKIYEDVKKA